MELDIWRGDWGLPSFDTECLKFIITAKIAGAPLKYNVTNNPFRTPEGYLPVLRDQKLKFSKYEMAVQHLKSQGYDADKLLPGPQQSQIEAYDSHLKDKLWPGIQYMLWVDAKNYTEFTRPWYAKALPFPLNYIYPGKFERAAKELLEVIHGHEPKMKQLENLVYADAKKCLTQLSQRLGDNQYFLGPEPTSLDAVVFAYIAPLVRAPLPSFGLQNHIKLCTNLVQFVDRISALYFSDTHKEYLKTKSKLSEENGRNSQQKSKTDKGQGDADDFPNKGRSAVLAGVVAFTAMVGYALCTGLLQITRMNTEDYPEDIFENDQETED